MITDSLRQLEDSNVKTFAALAYGRRTHQSSKKQYMERDRNICDAQRELLNGGFSVDEFLRAIAQRRIAEEEARMAARQQQEEEENSEVDTSIALKQYNFF